MPKARSVKRRSLPAPISCSDVAAADKADRLDSFSSLSLRQQSALSVVALSPSLNQAAIASGIGKTTLRRWMNDSAFREEVIRTRQEAAELARHEIRGLTLRAVVVINQAMDDPDPAIRLRAARCALSFGGKNSDIQSLVAELAELKDALDVGVTG